MHNGCDRCILRTNDGDLWTFLLSQIDSNPWGRQEKRDATMLTRININVAAKTHAYLLPAIKMKATFPARMKIIRTSLTNLLDPKQVFPRI